MYKHSNVGNKTDNVIDGTKTDNVSDDDIDEKDDDELRRTFFNPSQSDESDSSTESAKMIKCGMCVFKRRHMTDLRKHKEGKDNGCPFSYSTFESKQKLERHKNELHSVNEEKYGILLLL